jgi:hypothetical protein
MAAAVAGAGTGTEKPKADEAKSVTPEADRQPVDRPGAEAPAADRADGDRTAAAASAPASQQAPGEPDSSQYRDIDDAPGGAEPERSPASQWLILVAQVLASAVAGAALFIGFQLLWRDLPWVAFALAIVVIVGLVAMVRVLRRSNDSVSIALAVIVGLGVTCGPLLLRLVS